MYDINWNENNGLDKKRQLYNCRADEYSGGDFDFDGRRVWLTNH